MTPEQARRRDAWRLGYQDAQNGMGYQGHPVPELRRDYREGYDAGDRQRKDAE